MPFDDPDEQENETLTQPFPLRSMYPAVADDDQDAGLSAGLPVPDEQAQAAAPQFQRQFGAPPQEMPKPSIGQRILALRQQRTPLDASAVATTTMPRSVGSNIISGVRQAADSWQTPPLTLRSGAAPASVDFNQAQRGIFGDFIPVGAGSVGDGRNKPAPASSSMALSPDQQHDSHAVPGREAPIVNAQGLTRQPSKIRRPPTAPDVLPNLRISNPQGLRKTLSGLMQSIRQSHPPRGTQPTVQSRGRTVTLIYPDGRRETRRGNHPQRDNNPGNMEGGAFSRSHGQIGTDKKFAVFPTPEAGWAAMDAKLKSDEYWGLSIDDAVSKWAPPKNPKGQIINDTAGYQKKVRAALGVTGDTKVSTLTPQQFEALKQAMARIEGFYESRPNRKVKVVAQPTKPHPVNPKK